MENLSQDADRLTHGSSMVSLLKKIHGDLLLKLPQPFSLQNTTHVIIFHAKSAGTAEYTDYVSAGVVRPLPHECLGYDSKQSDGKVPIMQEIWRIQSIPSLPSLPGPLWPGVVPPDRVLLWIK